MKKKSLEDEKVKKDIKEIEEKLIDIGRKLPVAMHGVLVGRQMEAESVIRIVVDRLIEKIVELAREKDSW